MNIAENVVARWHEMEQDLMIVSTRRNRSHKSRTLLALAAQYGSLNK